MYKIINFYKISNRIYYFNERNKYNVIIKNIIDDIHKYTIVKRNGDYYCNNEYKICDNDGDLISSYRNDFVIEIQFNIIFKSLYSQNYLLYFEDENKRNEFYDYIDSLNKK
jgi:hypothetical protein